MPIFKINQTIPFFNDFKEKRVIKHYEKEGHADNSLFFFTFNTLQQKNLF
jgi:hypothetical protein